MTTCLLHPTYFPYIAHFTALIKADSVSIEVCDNYQKQSYRNRTDIYTTNGKLSLTVPVNYSQKQRQLYRDVKIANDNHWQKQHLKSLQSAYSMSPFFEYYIDDLMPVFEKSFDFILDLNLYCLDRILGALQLDIPIVKTTQFEKDVTDYIHDYRTLVHRKTNVVDFDPYTQVFIEKHGFISNLSILDLLFNEGPNSELYLQKQELKITSN